MDDDFMAELVQTFLLEFEELMELYHRSLHTLRTHSELTEERKAAFADIFRIFHTLKGDSGYFPEFANFTEFTKKFCEVLRPLDEKVYTDSEVYKKIRLNYTRLSSALNGLLKGRSLTSFNFSKY